MDLFVSLFVNKIDKKGRVSLPSIFRNVLPKKSKNEIILFKSLKFKSIEGCSSERINKIANKIDELDKNGTIDFYSKRVKEIREKGEKHNKKLEVKKETLRKKVSSHMESDKIVPADYPEPYKSMWEKLQDQEDWGAHYPFDADNVREFGKFCKESGGFEIC